MMPTSMLRSVANRLIFACTILSMLTLTPVAGITQERPRMSVMALYGQAPTLEFEGESHSGGLLGVAGDLVLLGGIVGRLQADMLQASSVTGPNADNVEGGFSIVGSLGYRLQFASLPRLSIDLLAHGGYAQVSYTNNGIDFMDVSPQFGVGIAPHVMLTNRLGVTFSARTLQGADVAGGTAINRTDIFVGGRLVLF